MKKGVIILSVILSVLLIGVVSAVTIPIYVRPLLPDGSSTPNTVYVYTLNWTTDQACNNVVYSNQNISVTTDASGVAVFNVTIPDNITAVPTYVCEYRNGVFRDAHQLTGQIFSQIYAQSLNISDKIYAGGNVTGAGGFFQFLGSLLNRITSLFVTNIDASGNVSAAYFFGNGSQLTGIPGGSNPSFTNVNISNLLTLNSQISPTGANNGSLFFNSSLNAPMFYNGTSWIGLSGTGFGTSIISSGSNANGYWIQYADGTMMEATNGSMTFSVSGSTISWTFPLPFTTTYYATLFPANWNAVWYSNGFSTTSVNAGSNTFSGSVLAYGYAIGRWTNLNLQTGAGISNLPIGSVIAFNSATCPSGWQVADGTNGSPDLRGLFIRGAGTNGNITESNGSSYSAIFGTYQNDSFQGHWHQQYTGTQITTTGSNGRVAADYNIPTAMVGPFIGGVRDAINDTTNGVPRTGAETRPANYVLTYCIKMLKGDIGDVAIWGLDSNGNIAEVNSSRNVTVTNLNVTGTIYGATSSRTQIFTSSGTFTVPSGITTVYLSGTGAGGTGGAGSNFANCGGYGYCCGGGGGGGGGAGSAYYKIPVTVTPGSQITVTIGTSGITSTFGSLYNFTAGTTGALGNPGNGYSSSGTVCYNGGGGGSFYGSAGGKGGNSGGTNGDTGGGGLMYGGNGGGGGTGVNSNCGGGGGGGGGAPSRWITSSLGGDGGTGGTYGGANPTAGASSSTRGAGGGGGGGPSCNNGNGAAGGSGGSGLIIVEW